MTAALILGLFLAGPGTDTPYDLDPLPHGVAVLGMIGTIGVGEVWVKPALQAGFNCALEPSGGRCDAKHLWGLDQSTVGDKSLAWRRMSDVGALTSLLAPVGAYGLDSWLAGSLTPWLDAGLDTLVQLEAVSVATFITLAFKYGVRRPRPGLYAPGEPTADGQLSFPSGHASATAAACVAYSTNFALRHPNSPWRFAVMGGSALLTGITAYGRVAGGMHFYSDVLAGTILGASVGFIIPYVLRKHPNVEVAVVGGDGPRTQRLQVSMTY